MFCPVCHIEVETQHADLDDCIAALTRSREELEASLRELVDRKAREDAPVETGLKKSG